MKAIFTSDWQTQVSNLDRIELVSKNLLAIVQKRDLDYVVVAGDLKHQYSPIPVPIVLWWRKFIIQIREAGAIPILLLGNHDRVNLYQDEINWLPILQDAGAKVFDSVGVVKVGQESIFVFPFVGTTERFDTELKKLHQLSSKANPKKDILVFHQTLTGAMFNKSGIVADPGKGIPLSSLKPERFRYCIGGDIHLPQQVGKNTWYVGSPFPMDWGEANQEKFFAVVTDKGLEWVSTGMPGWYDTSVKGFKAPTTWSGTRIRVKVPVYAGEDYGAKLAEAKTIVQNKYSGATVTVIPELQEIESKEAVLDLDVSEQGQIRSYVKQVWPEELLEYQEQAVAYLEYKIQATKMGFRLDTGVRFKKAWAKNFLSFKTVELYLDGGGLTIITGINHDWVGRSNGSGKSNLTSLLSVALFGKTPKGQAHDDWTTNGCEEQSVVSLEWITADGSLVRVERTRNPSSVRLWVNGTEQSAGGKQRDVSKDIEMLCGFSWDMFVSLIYISREEQSFLWGTPKQKQETFSRLQNLERFGVAQKLVSKDIQKTQNMKQQWEYELELLGQSIEEKKQYNQPAAEVAILKKKLGVVQKESAGISIPEIGALKQKMEVAKEVHQNYYTKQNKQAVSITAKQTRLNEFTGLLDKCPTCGQKIPRDRVAIDKVIISLQGEIKTERAAFNVVAKEVQVASENYLKACNTYDNARKEQYLLEAKQQQLKDNEKELRQDIERWQAIGNSQAEELKQLQDSYKSIQAVAKVLEFELDFLQLANSILARDGLPAYLSQMLCPKINRAAEYFSELFSDGEIKVRFRIEEGEVVSEIINAHGGRNLTDQSVGEGSIATLITSFAFREVVTRTNLIVLDEPADGLDAANARAFANGIRKMKDTFGSVFLITHSDAIMAELADVKLITVEKQDGVSYVS